MMERLLFRGMLMIDNELSIPVMSDAMEMSKDRQKNRRTREGLFVLAGADVY